ncbi:MAG: ATP-dependent RecD-like DNA helicase [Eubacteriaceae bacterium]|jgi:exodeoxyribonuclease V alpha subunit|nr:ATP-dependent RecD-like DNA helicase [Eubacteriaceae bacterium]
MIEIQGVISNIVFRNEGNGWTVADIRTDDGKMRVTGTLLSCHSGRTYKLTGDIIVHPVYGEQFKFEEGEEVLSDTESGMAAFLASDLVKGIGPKTAEAIVRKFGKDTFDIIEKDPDKLTAVKGVSESKAGQINAAFVTYREFAAIEVGLQKYGISPAFALKLYQSYGVATMEIVENNPYALADDIDGIGFRKADAIAMSLGIAKDDEERIACGIRYIIANQSNRGDTYVPEENMYTYAADLLEAGREQVDDAVTMMTFEGSVMTDVIEGVKVIYLTSFYDAEKRVTGNLRMLSESDPAPINADMKSLIKTAEKETGIEYSEEQKNAIEHSLKNSVSVITGGPGTGKTTIINAIVRILDKSEFETSIAAPTGRAAKRITETSGFEAKTIHRLLEYYYDESSSSMRFGRNQENPLDAKAVIVDEASMIDLFLMDALLKALTPGTRLILVGDADQLPPVGAGNVLGDMIDSEYIASVKLHEIFRQAQESMIVVNAHLINSGRYPEYNGEGTDFFLLRHDKQQDILDTVTELCSKRLPEHYSELVPIRDIQVLTPVKKQIIGTENINSRLQAVLNPPQNMKQEKKFGDRTFREGDKVMQMRNNYDLKWRRSDDFSEGEGVFNGDVGFIEKIDNDDKRMIVIYEDVKYVTYDFSQLDELELAYAITVHKSQGSEFPIVVMPVSAFPPMLATRNLLYTAVTRGKQAVVLVGSEKRLEAMVDNNMITERCSGLKERLAALIMPESN